MKEKRFSAQAMSDYIGVPVDHVREHESYDADTDTVSANAPMLELRQELGALGAALWKVYEPLFAWLDRQLRRSPRLYGWLSR